MKIGVVITSAGTASAVSVIKSLRMQRELDLKLIAIDSDPMAAGLRLADKSYVVPRAAAQGYVEALIDLARKEKSTVLMPMYSGEMEIVASQKNILQNNGLRMLMSEPWTVQTCNDKLAMHRFALQNGIRTPATLTSAEIQDLVTLDYPVFSKPRWGRSSIGAVKIESQRELEFFLGDETVRLFQEYIPGQEITVDALCNSSHQAIVVAPRLRLETKAGQSVKAVTIDSAPFQRIVCDISAKLKLVGACNFQFIDSGSDRVLIEVNPRFAAGGLMLTVNAGANIPLLVLKEILGIEISEAECLTRSEVFMTRYWEEVIWKDACCHLEG